MAIAPRHPNEKWDLLNFPGLYRCYPKALRSARSMAKKRNAPIMVRHHGPHHLEDDTRVNQYVNPNGNVDIRRDESGRAIDVS